MLSLNQPWRLFAALNLLILGGFLVFWLRGEYLDERVALKNEAHLRIAKTLLGQTGIDFNFLMEALEEENGEELSFNISFETGELDALPPGVDSSVGQSFQIIKMELPELPEGPILKDSLSQIDHPNYQKLYVGEEDTVIHALSVLKQTSAFANQLSESIDTTFVNDLRAQLDQENQLIKWKALKKILPQIGFAFFLLALSILATYMIQRNFQERQRLLEGKNTFISNMTHELQTPVATISVALEAIQDFNVREEPAKADAYLSASRKELKRLSNLIDQVLSFSKMDAGKASYHFAEADLQDVLQLALDPLALAIQQKQAVVKVSAAATVYPIKADTFHLRQAIQNLIDNSLKYGSKGVQITIQLADTGDHWTLKVKDNGPGIAKKDQKKVFDRFYRVREGEVHTVKGYGLGLSYVQEVVGAHGGVVDLTSHVGEGTTVVITLPKENSN